LAEEGEWAIALDFGLSENRWKIFLSENFRQFGTDKPLFGETF